MIQSNSLIQKPKIISAAELFPEFAQAIAHINIPYFADKSDWVPAIDEHYRFDETALVIILSALSHNLRALLFGLHGSGKSSHIEQVAARLNWGCVRINLDSQITRMDLIGRDVIALEDGKQITKFQEGLVPFAMQNPLILVFDEYDAGRPDVMFVIQRLLEAEGKLTLLEQERIISPNPYFRLMATANTVGSGDHAGIYQGTQIINQAQLDRWQIVHEMKYMPKEQEVALLLAKFPYLADLQYSANQHDDGNGNNNIDVAKAMVDLAGLIRAGFMCGDIGTIMSPRTMLSWAQNTEIFAGNVKTALRLSYLNKCDASEYHIINEYYQRCFADEL